MADTILTQEVVRNVKKSIRYDRESRDYACYLIFPDGIENFIGYADTYHEGETLCSSEYYKLLDEAQNTTAASVDDMPAGIPDDVVEIVNLSFPDGQEDWAQYCVRDTQVGIEERFITVEVGCHSIDMNRSDGLVALRALSFILEHPDIRRLIGRDTPPAAALVVPFVLSDRYGIDEDEEPTNSVSFRLNNAEVDVNPYGRFSGVLAVAVDGHYIESVNPQNFQDAAALLNSPQVHRARIRSEAGLHGFKVAA